jgi:dihydrofolate synthase/folylpolyglutamate synthase
LSPRTLDDWLAYISAQHPSTIALGLDRVRAVWERMGLDPGPSPQGGGRDDEPVAPDAATRQRAGAQSPVFFTVGGTNGKGSTCAFLEAILAEAGYRVGLYTSPHLLRYNERVRVNLVEADDDSLVRAFGQVEAARQDTSLTYFEFGTLAALAVFAEAKLDAVILEVGLGGRLDAVNVVDADVSIVASVDLDHQSFLGNDVESIGFEKAGIFRAGRPAIFGDANPPRRLVDQAAEIGAKLQVLGTDFRYEAQDRQWDFIGAKGARRALPIPALRGRYQLKNAASALAALDEVSEQLPISLGEVKRGLTNVRLPGRLQALPGRPVIVLDVAHNPHAARALADGLADMGFARNTFAVFGMLGDKDIGGVVDAVRHRFDRWYLAAPEADRAASAAEMARILDERGLGAVTRTFASVALALEAARRDAGADDRIVVFGSFYTVAEGLRSAR